MVPEYVKSREFHKSLRNIWDSTFKTLGYKKCKGSLASYFRPRKDGHGYLRFWTQASQFGDSWSGNTFTTNIDISISDPHAPFGGSDRCLGKLPPTELKAAEVIVEKVIRRKPKPAAGRWIYEELKDGANKEFWQRAFESEFTYRPKVIHPLCDVWLPYFSIEDVQEWAKFLAPLLPKLFDEIEKSNKIFGPALLADEFGKVNFKRNLSDR